jgi:acrylyl-CoA reductase (NADPH)
VPTGSVAACSLAGGTALNTTVFRFILRGVNLLGINSVYCSQIDRHLIWERLSQDLSLSLLEGMTQEFQLADVFALGEKSIAGAIRGRTVIRIPE